MAKALQQVVQSRMDKMATYIPKGYNTDPYQDTVQGPLFLASTESKHIVKGLIPLIKKSSGELTIQVIDTWLEKRAKKDFLNAN